MRCRAVVAVIVPRLAHAWLNREDKLNVDDTELVIEYSMAACMRRYGIGRV